MCKELECISECVRVGVYKWVCKRLEYRRRLTFVSKLW